MKYRHCKPYISTTTTHPNDNRNQNNCIFGDIDGSYINICTNINSNNCAKHFDITVDIINFMKICYCVIIYFGYFCLPDYIQFLSNPCVICQNLWFKHRSPCSLCQNYCFLRQFVSFLFPLCW